MEKQAKKTKVVTTMTETAKRKSAEKPVKPELVKKNLKDSAKEVKAEEKGTETIAQREVKYNYPADCISPDQRKEFRRKSRAIARRSEKKVKALEASTDPAAKKDLTTFQAEVNEWKQKTYTHLN